MEDKSSNLDEQTKRGADSSLTTLGKTIFGGVHYIVKDNLGELVTSPVYGKSGFIERMVEPRQNGVIAGIHSLFTNIDRINSLLQTKFNGKDELLSTLSAAIDKNTGKFTHIEVDNDFTKGRPFLAGNIQIYYMNGAVEIPMILTTEQATHIRVLDTDVRKKEYDSETKMWYRKDDTQVDSYKLQAARLARVATLNNLKTMRDFAEQKREKYLAIGLNEAYVRLLEAKDYNISLTFAAREESEQ